MVALPTVGFDFLRQKPGTNQVLQSNKLPSSVTEIAEVQLVLESRKNGVFASAVEVNGEVTVIAGASATKKEFASNNYALRRQELIRTNTLVLNSTGDLYTLSKDTTFRSPSEAAAVLLNRNSNGRTEWRVAGTDLTLKAWQDNQLEAVSSPS